MNTSSPPINRTTDTRRNTLLDAAIVVFARYGFRKTSMDDVARAAGVSRQGLYLSFNSKEELFREALTHLLDSQLNAARSALERSDECLESRLVAACDEWCGRFVGAIGSDASDLMCASTVLAGGTLADYQSRFEKAVTRVLADSGLVGFCSSQGFCPADLARAMHATAQGLKHSSASRQDFVKSMTVAARMFCSPLHQPT